MGILATFTAKKAYLSHAKSIRANDTKNYAQAIELEQKAMAGYEAAIAKGLTKAEYLMSYCVLLMRNGKFDRAMEIIRLTEQLPNLTQDHKRTLTMNYAICKWKLGDLDRAIGAMRELKKNFKNGNVYGSLGYMLLELGDRTGDYTEAKKFNDESLDYDDEDAIILDNVGQYYMRTNDFAQAKKYLEKALEIRPVQVDSMYNLAKLRYMDGDIAGAKELVDNALEIHFSALATVTVEDLKEFKKKLESAK